MSSTESMATADSIVSPIQQAGNYFIMDSEQLVCNPLLQLQNEAIDSVKKTSLTEKLTAVKNNVCETKYRTAATHLEREKLHKLRQIHIDSSNLRYEAKLMDISRRQHDLEMQKRFEPEKDFTYDSNQIKKTAKGLGVISLDSCYLDRKLKYPLRGHALRDPNAKPIIRKARQSMIELGQKKRQEQEERATSSQTMSTAINLPSSASILGRGHQRRGSKSAPPNSKRYLSASLSQPNSVQDEDELDAKLPSLNSHRTPIRSKATSHVKFQVQEPLFRQNPPEGISRARTFHSGMTRRYSEALDSDSDEDYDPGERVDLYALFFGNKSQFDNTGNTTPQPLTRQSTDVPIILRASTAKPITEEHIKQEKKQLREKIDKFLGNIHSEEELREMKKQEELERMKQAEEEEEKPPQDNPKSKASALLSIFSKPLEPRKQWGYKSPSPTKKKADEPDSRLHTPAGDRKTPEMPKAEKRNLWELIKTEIKEGNVREKYTANDLLLQQLTGIFIEKNKRNVIPVHAASRALRHTPTFKMQKVVEDLMKQRTRYEQQEVEKLQNQTNEEGQEVNGLEGVKYYPTKAWTSTSQTQKQTT